MFPDRISASILTSLWFVLIYNGANWISSQRTDHFQAAFGWEKHIPFVPLMIVPYWSLDLFFFLAPFVIATKHELHVYRLRMLTAIGIAGAMFLLFPLELMFVRPEVPGFLGELFGALENCNNFWNLAPSLHIAIRTVLWPVFCGRISGWWGAILKSWFFAIGLSTLLCWQHQVIDVFTGQLLGLFVGVIFPYFDRGHVSEKTQVLGAKSGSLGALYLVGGIALVILGKMCCLVGVFLLWPALSCLIFAAAYLSSQPWLLGKDPLTGKVSHGTSLLLFPVVFAADICQVYLLRNEPDAYQVNPKLSFGRHPRFFRGEAIRPERFVDVTIIDLTAEFPFSKNVIVRKGLCYPLLDLIIPSMRALEEICLILKHSLSTGPVYLHCALGRGRSAISVAAWLISSGQVSTVEEAIEAVKNVCPVAVLPIRAKERLEEFKVHCGKR